MTAVWILYSAVCCDHQDIISVWATEELAMAEKQRMVDRVERVRGGIATDDGVDVEKWEIQTERLRNSKDFLSVVRDD